jgi:hypothetical protein
LFVATARNNRIPTFQEQKMSKRSAAKVEKDADVRIPFAQIETNDVNNNTFVKIDGAGFAVSAYHKLGVDVEAAEARCCGRWCRD